MLWIMFSLLWCTLSLSIWLILKKRYATLYPLQPTSPTVDAPSVTIILPVKDEAENIRPCLDSLVKQVYPPDRLGIIVVNDNSSDETAEIARTYSDGTVPVTLVEAGALPEGWLGKSHACWQGSQRAKGHWLCFLDADTRHDPSLIASAVNHAEEQWIDVLSLHPQQQILGFWERLLMPIPMMNLMILMNTSAINDPGSVQAMANGQFILVKREAYLQAGGHKAIRDQVLEDVALARLLKRNGNKLILLGGDSLIHTRMYSKLSDLWEGLARGGSELFGIPLTTVAVLTSLFMSFLPLLYPAWRTSRALTLPDITSLSSAGFAILGSAFWYAAHALALRVYRIPLSYLFLLPLSYLFIASVNAEGILRRWKGSRTWKGRVIG